MKLIWCPETAAKAYIDTMKFCGLSMESSAPELISASAGGWNSKLIVEAWTTNNTARGCGAMKTNIGLAIASGHTGGRHVCIVADEKARQEYMNLAMQEFPAGLKLPEVIMVGELMERLTGIDFLVVDGSCNKDIVTASRVFRLAKFSHLGAVLMRKNVGSGKSNSLSNSFKWDEVVDGSAVRIVRSRNLPIGSGIDVAYVVGAAGEKQCLGKVITKGWIRHIDQQSGEEHVFRKLSIHLVIKQRDLLNI